MTNDISLPIIEPISVSVWSEPTDEDGIHREAYDLSSKGGPGRDLMMITGRGGFIMWRKMLHKKLPWFIPTYKLNGTIMSEDEFFSIMGIEIDYES